MNIPYSELKKHRSELKDVVPLKKPYVVFVEPSSLCNYQCAQCFQSLESDSYFHRNRTNLDFSLFKDIIYQIRDWEKEPLRSLRLSLFGEPLLNPKFADMVKLAKELKVADRIETTTNLSLLTEEIATKIVESGLDYIRVSVYAVDEHRHRQVVKNDITPSEILDKVKLLRRVRDERGSLTPFIAVKMFRTYDEEEIMFKEMYQGVADEAYLDILHNWTSEDDFVGNYYKDKAGFARIEIEKYDNGKNICPYPFYSLVIKSTGDVSTCCADWSGGTNILNVENLKLKEIWNSKELYEFRKMQIEGRKDENISCKGCTQCSSSYYTLSSVDGIDIKMFEMGGD